MLGEGFSLAGKGYVLSVQTCPLASDENECSSIMKGDMCHISFSEDFDMEVISSYAEKPAPPLLGLAGAQNGLALPASPWSSGQPTYPSPSTGFLGMGVCSARVHSLSPTGSHEEVESSFVVSMDCSE